MLKAENAEEWYRIIPMYQMYKYVRADSIMLGRFFYRWLALGEGCSAQIVRATSFRESLFVLACWLLGFSMPSMCRPRYCWPSPPWALVVSLSVPSTCL